MVDDMMDELDTLSALAERLVPHGLADLPMSGRRRPPGPPIVIRPAGLPAELRQLGMPVPIGSRLIGSCTSGTSSLTFLDAEQSPLDVLRFYEGELDARGWIRTDGGPRGALWQGDLPIARAMFCRSSSGPSLHVQLDENPGRGTDIRLQLETDPQRSRQGALPPPVPPPPALPSRLPIPPNARAAGGSGATQSGGIYQVLRTIQYLPIAVNPRQWLPHGVAQDPFRFDPGLEGVADYYAEVLTEEGWTRRRAGRTDPAAWSTWTCPNEKGQEVAAFFLVVQEVDHLYSLQLECDLAPGSREKAERESREQVRGRTREAEEVRVEMAGAATDDVASALRELLLRIALPPPGHNPRDEALQLVAGRLPEGLPITLPLPPGSRVLGSLVTGSRMTIYLSSRTRPRPLLDFYREQLSFPVWTFFGELPQWGGFLPQWLPDPAMLEPVTGQFCSEVGGPGVTVMAQVRRVGATEARITVEADPIRTPCGNSMAAADYHRRPCAQLPVLVAPPESDFVEAEGFTGGGTDRTIRGEARGYLYTAMDLEAVAAHYGRQFEAAGREREAEGRDDVVAWSTWSRDEGWQQEDTLFLATRYPDTDRYLLQACAVGR